MLIVGHKDITSWLFEQKKWNARTYLSIRFLIVHERRPTGLKRKRAQHLVHDRSSLTPPGATGQEPISYRTRVELHLRLPAASRIWLFGRWISTVSFENSRILAVYISGRAQ